MKNMSETEGDAFRDRVLPATRVLAAIVVPFLVVAFGMLYFFPDISGTLFAWPIKPHMSAMMLGATYLGGAYFFTNVIFAKRWHTVRLGFLPVTAFAAILGISTLLHWDKFTHGHPSFISWAVLYFTLPFIIPVVWYLNQRAAPAGAPRSEPTFSGGLRAVLGLLGGVLIGAAAIFLVAPGLMIPLWPWAMTPLTARVMAAMFALAGGVGLATARDGHWSSARVVFGAQAIAVVLFLLASVLSRADIHWEMATSYTFIGGMMLVLALIAGAAVQVWRARRQVAAPVT